MSPPTQLTDLFRMAIDRAEDDTFLQALREDPQGAIARTFGVTFMPPDVIPDDELDGVVGGAGIPGRLPAFDLRGLDLAPALAALAPTGPSDRRHEAYAILSAFLNAQAHTAIKGTSR